MTGLEPKVVWVCGASAAGKSAAAWALFEALARDGMRVAYVDIDQLGMLYPERDDDPERHLLKEEALTALLPGYGAAGAQVLVVSGVVDPQAGPAALLASDVDVTLCLLSADPATLHERIGARGWDQETASEAVADNAALRIATFIGGTVETAGLSVSDTVERLRPYVGVVGPAPAPPPMSDALRPSPSDMDVLVVTGPRAAGSSTVGFGLAMTRWQAGLRTAFVDLQQLAFVAGPRSSLITAPPLLATQLALIHAFMAGRGASLLVVSGQLSVDDRVALREALPAAPVTIVRLRADAATLESHVGERLTGSAARLAGDDLLGADSERQASLVANALAHQVLLDASANDDAVLDVTGRTAADAIADIKRLVASRTLA